MIKVATKRINLPVVNFFRKEDIETGLAILGHKPSDVFFKCSYPSALQIWGSPERSRLDKDFTGTYLVDEAHQLSKIHKTCPANTALPVAIASRGGKPVGYFMEFVEGKLLSSYKNEWKETDDVKREEFRLAIKELIEVSSMLHKNSIAHGDLSFGNIFYTKSGIKLIDPLTPMGLYVLNLDESDVAKSGLRNMFKRHNPFGSMPVELSEAEMSMIESETDMIANDKDRLVKLLLDAEAEDISTIIDHKSFLRLFK